MTLLERIEAKYIPEPNSGCWIWLGALSGGYARIGVQEGPTLVSRILYEQKFGKIPDGLEVDHLCRVRCCVNPDHLEAVTKRENWRRGNALSAQQARQTHCKRGHEFTRISKTKWGFARYCKTCRDLRRKGELEMNDLPERFKNRETRRSIAKAVVAGLSSSQPPYLSIAGTAFTLVDSSGEQEAIEAKWIDVVIMDVNERVPVQRVFRGKGAKYDQNDPKPPICFSDNGIGASSAAQQPQSDNCKTCQWSRWDSDVSPMTGKGVPACKVYKKLAVLPLSGDSPMYEFPFLLRVPVMSHDALQAYGNKFNSPDVPDVSEIVTRISLVHGKVGQLEFEVRKENPWPTDNVDKLIDTLLKGHATDSMIGRNDVPWQGQIAAPQQETPKQVEPPKGSEVQGSTVQPTRRLGRPKKDGDAPLEPSSAPQPPPPKPAPAGTARPLPSFLQQQTKEEPVLDKQPAAPTSMPSDLQAALQRTFNLKA